MGVYWDICWNIALFFSLVNLVKIVAFLEHFPNFVGHSETTLLIRLSQLTVHLFAHLRHIRIEARSVR